MGRVKKKRTVPLSLFYLKYFTYLFLAVLIIAAAIVFAFSCLIASGIIYPASYAQEQAGNAYDEIMDAEEVSEEIIPELCQYAIFDMDGNAISGNMKETGIKSAWAAVQGDTSDFYGNYYSVIQREREYCVLRYKIVPQYKSPVLRQYLLSPQNLLLLVGLLLILLVVVWTAICFGRALRKKLEPLIQATEKVQNQELEFAIAPSDIREIDTVLSSMDKMRKALKESLERQWHMEQSRKEQMSALTHDLKTPLTLIRGNAELLYDTNLTEEQRECMDYIEKSSLQMQNYVQLLMEAAKSQNALQLQKKPVKLHCFLQEIKNQCRGLCAVGKICLKWQCDCREQEIFVDASFFARALINICANAVEHTPSGGTVFFHVYDENEYLIFSISDTGKGFSAEALKHATEQFYMEDRSRGSKSHFGIGLYMADSIIKQHGGQLILKNAKETHGAEVQVKINPFFKQKS